MCVAKEYAMQSGPRHVTVKRTEKQLRKRKCAKYSENENKNENFTVKYFTMKLPFYLTLKFL